MLRWRGHRGRDPRTKSECIVELRERLYDPDLVQRAIASCDDVTRDALALLRRKGGAMPASAMRGQIATWHPDLPGDAVQRVPSELVRRALAFWHVPAGRYAGASVHDVLRPAGDNPRAALVFSEPEILDHVSVPPALGQTTLVSRGEAEGSESPQQSVRQIVSFLRAIESRSPRVLRTGVIGTRDRVALARLAGLEGAESSRNGSGGDIAPEGGGSPINFLHRAMLDSSVIRMSPEGQLQTSELAADFVGSSPVNQAQTMLHAWLQSGDSVLFELSHLRCDRRANAPTVVPSPNETRQAYRRLVDLLRQVAKPGYWYAFSDLSNVVRHDDVEFLISWRDPSPYDWRPYDVDRDSYVPTSYVGITLEDSRGRPRSLTMGVDWELVEGAFIRAVLRGPLSWLGLIRTGYSADGNEAFCLTRLGAAALDIGGTGLKVDEDSAASQSDALVVQPNFDIVVYEPDERPQLLFHVDRFADRISVDRLAVYHLTRESLSRGLQLGMSVDDIVSLLEASARTPLPQNVTFTVRDWARQFDRICLTRHCWLLEAPDAATFDRWLEDPVVAGALDHRLTPTLALVSDTVALRNRLIQLGVDSRAVDAESPISASAKVLDDATLLVPKAEANLYLEIELGAFADLSVDADQRTIVRLSEQSIRRGVENGLRWSYIVAALGQLTNQPLPAGMLSRIKGWCGAYEPVEFARVAYVETADPITFSELWADPELFAGVVALVSPVGAIIRADAVEQFRSALAKRGIVTRELNFEARPLEPRRTGFGWNHDTTDDLELERESRGDVEVEA